MTNKSAKNAVMAIYKSHSEAKAVVQKLQRSGSSRVKLLERLHSQWFAA